MSTNDDSPQQHQRSLIIAALGVVFGDIGTSPLYGLKECFYGVHAVALHPANVVGILSLIFWSLVLVVGVKYLAFIMRADNNGEGGTFALLALLMPKTTDAQGNIPQHRKVIYLGLFGAALLYGDGMITPAISVLSAVEGLEVATPVFRPFIVPITVGILVALFLVQSGGTGKIGRVFGPAILVYFAAIAAVAIPWIVREPMVLQAINPLHAVQFFASNGAIGFWVLSAVVLCFTGGEALYADMGHFGVRPIRFAWSFCVFPALIINYFGQGAYLIAHGSQGLGNPFYALVPAPFLYPMVAICTVATVIASQALISGAFSLTHQAIQLGMLPRLTVVHTSEHLEGQTYVPRVNQLLMVGCIALVVLFKESTNLATAYGIAVTGTMAITSLLFYPVAVYRFGWPKVPTFVLVFVFLLIDLTFFTANTAKFLQGGWVPVLIGMILFGLMTTWRRGRAVLSQALFKRAMPLQDFIRMAAEVNDGKGAPRVKGTAIFMTPNLGIAPGTLLHHFKHNQVLHERVVLLTILTKHVPYVPVYEHGRLTELEHGFCQLVAKYGYMERPDLYQILKFGQLGDLDHDREKFSFYLGRETILTTGLSGMGRWRKALFSFLSRNALPATQFFRIPPDRVIEVGLQLEI